MPAMSATSTATSSPPTAANPNSPGAAHEKPLSAGWRRGAFALAAGLVVSGLVARVTQHAAGQVAGVVAFLHQHLAVDKGGVDPRRRFLEAPAAGREVVHNEFRQRLHGVGIEDRDVGLHTRPQ